MRLSAWSRRAALVRSSAVARIIAVTVAGTIAVTGLSAAPATARTVDTSGPDYELPFPCAQTWTGTTRSNHRPSALSIDFNRPGDLRDLMVASAPGVVTRVADTGNTSYGKYVIVDHGGDHSSMYAHLNAVWVTPGQRVDQGDLLGRVGASGGVSGAHLHFEERVGSRVRAAAFHRKAFTFGTTLASANCPDVPLTGDWNNDRIDDVAVFRRGRESGLFRLRRAGAPAAVIAYGRNSDQPVTGDWDGDGLTDVGVRRPSTRTFLLRNADGATTSVRFGFRPDVALTGDWDGDGVTDLGLWRPATATFRLRNASGRMRSVSLGWVGSAPVTGDWNADGVTDLGVFEASTSTFTLRITTGDGQPWFRMVKLGPGSSLPVTGDWDGDGFTDVGSWSPATATFSLRTAALNDPSTATVSTRRFGKRRN